MTGLLALAAALSIGNELQVMWDDYIVDTNRTTAASVQHAPQFVEEVFTHDLPWEGDGCDFHCIFRDGDIWRMYYNGYSFDIHRDHPKTNAIPASGLRVCYAESRDGLTWERPNLGLFAFKGSKANNIVVDSSLHPGLDNFYVFKDPNPKCPSNELYKAVTLYDKGLHFFFSSDGLHFRYGRLITKEGAFDTLNTMIWNPRDGKYYCYIRGFHAVAAERNGDLNVRDIRVTVSADGYSWSTPTLVDFGPGAEDYPLYTNVMQPYERNSRIWIGFPSRYVERRTWTKNFNRLSNPVERRRRMYDMGWAHPRHGLTTTDCLFMSTRDGYHFNRRDEAFMTPGPEHPYNWVYGDCYPAVGLIPVKGRRGAADELAFYCYTGHWLGEPESFDRYRIRMDGFISRRAPYAGARVVTKPFVFAGDEMLVNFATSARGRMFITIRDEHDATLRSVELFGDQVDRVVDFEEERLGEFAGRVVTAEFEMSDADLYSFRFRPCEGRMSVSNGTLTVHGKARLAEDVWVEPFTNVVLLAGSRLEVADAYCLPALPGRRFELAQGASLVLARGVNLQAAAFLVDGQAQTGEIACGDGTVTVARTYVWTGGGGDRFSDPANWQGGTLPDFSRTANFLFPVIKPGTYLCDVALKANLLDFNDMDAFGTVWINDGGNGSITIGSGGVRASLSKTEWAGRYYVLNLPVFVKGNQTWNVCGGADFYVAGTGNLRDVDSTAPATVFKTGPGGLHVQTPDSPFTGTFEVRQGVLAPEYARVIATNGALVVNGGAERARISSYETMVVAPVEIRVGRDGEMASDAVLRSENGLVETYLGPVSYAGTDGHYLFGAACNGSRLVFAGGVNGTTGARFSFLEGTGAAGCIVVTNKPWVSSSYLMTSAPSAGRLVFAVPGNVFTSLGKDANASSWGATYVTTVDNAFANAEMALNFANLAVLDLCGTRQSVGDLCFTHSDVICKSFGTAPALITNSAARVAVLTVKQSGDDRVFEGALGGAVDFNLAAESIKTLTIVHPVSAQGAIAVRGGKLAFQAGASWPQAKSVAVSGNGRLELSVAPFATTVALTLDSAQNLELGAGVVQVVQRAVVKGVSLPAGDHAFGAGVIRVQNPSTTLVLTRTSTKSM